MKKLYILLLFLFICSNSFGQTLYQEDFETDTNGTNYTTSIVELTDGFNDFFTRTDGSNINTSYVVSNISNSFYFAAQDIDGDQPTNPASLSTFPIDVTGLTDIDFVILLAEDDDGANQDWDDADFMHITYSIDGGAAQNVLWVEGDETSGTASNSTPRIDTNFDGTGNGTEITSTFSEFVVSDIPIGGGASIVFTMEFSLDSGDEDLAIDNIRIYDTYAASPTIITGADVTGLNYVLGAGPSSVGSFTVEGTDLTNNIMLSAPTNFEISETSGSGFGTSITLTQSGGIVASTTIYAQLKSGLTVNSYSGDIDITSTGATANTVNLSGDVFNPPTNALMIKGVFDNATGSTPKGIELEVLANIPDLSIFGVGSANNGGGTDGQEFTFPAVAATTGDLIYVVSTGQIADFNTFFSLSITEYESGAMSINGDDAIELFESGQVIDVFGTIDCDPNATASACPEWEHTDGWAYRNTVGPSTTFLHTEWDYSGVGNLDGATNEASTEPYPGATLAINEYNSTNFNVYPNPTNTGFVIITSASNDLLRVNIFDILGKEVLESTVTNNQINVSSLNAGVYILKLTQNNASTTKKLVIQ